MDLLIVEPLEPEVLQWLQERHRVRYAPELARDPRAFRQVLFNVRAAMLPPTLRLDAETLSFAPLLRAVGRAGPGLENIDVDACQQLGVELVRGTSATAPAEAEFLLGAIIAMLRPGMADTRVGGGRELASATVGLVGLAPAARSMAALLSGFGSRLVGYDPTLHAKDLLWGRWRIEPMGLRELLEVSHAVCVQLPYYTRYQGLLGERYLPYCKPGQVLVSTSHSALFDEIALAQAVRSGRIGSVWLDSVEPGLLEAGRPLHGLAQVRSTPRLAGYTQESRVRSVWSVVHRLDEILSQTPPVARDFRPSAASPLSGPVSMPGPLTGVPTAVTVAQGERASPADPLATPELRALDDPLEPPGGRRSTPAAPSADRPSDAKRPDDKPDAA